MGKLRIAPTECNYKEIHRQLKKQFIQGLTDSDMSIEIIKELTKIKGNNSATSEQVLVWARGVEAQKVQSAILENLSETKYFDKIFTRNRMERENEMQLQEQIRMPMW